MVPFVDRPNQIQKQKQLYNPKSLNAASLDAVKAAFKSLDCPITWTLTTLACFGGMVGIAGAGTRKAILLTQTGTSDPLGTTCAISLFILATGLVFGSMIQIVSSRERNERTL